MMDNRILAVHYRCHECGKSFIRIPDDERLLSHGAVCANDGYVMVTQYVWENCTIEKCHEWEHINPARDGG